MEECFNHHSWQPMRNIQAKYQNTKQETAERHKKDEASLSMPGLPPYPEREETVTHSCLSAKKETKSWECLEPRNLNSPLNSCSCSCRISRHLAASPDLGAHTASCHGYLRHLQKGSHKLPTWPQRPSTEDQEGLQTSLQLLPALTNYAED